MRVHYDYNVSHHILALFEEVSNKIISHIITKGMHRYSQGPIKTKPVSTNALYSHSANYLVLIF